MQDLAIMEMLVLRASFRRVLRSPLRALRGSMLAGFAMLVMGIVLVREPGVRHDELGVLQIPAALAVSLSIAFPLLGFAIARTLPRPEAVRAADLVWWRLAGVERSLRERFAVRVFGLRAALAALAIVGGGSLVCAAAVPEQSVAIAHFAVIASAVAFVTIGITIVVPPIPRRRDANRAETLLGHVDREGECEPSRDLAEPSQDRPEFARASDVVAIPPTRSALASRSAAMWLVRRAEPRRRVHAAGLATAAAIGFVAGGASRTIDPAVLAELELFFAIALVATLSRPERRRVVPGDHWWRLGVGVSLRTTAEWCVADAAGDGLTFAAMLAAFGIARSDLPFALGAVLALPAFAFVRAVDMLWCAVVPSDRGPLGFTIRAVTNVALAALVLASARAGGVALAAATLLAAASLTVVATARALARRA